MNERNMKNKRLPIWIFPVLMLVMIALVAIMPRSQDTRKGAYFAGTSLFLNPDNVGEKTVGEEFPVQLMVQTQNMTGTDELAKADFVKSTWCYEPGKVRIEGDDIPAGQSSVNLTTSLVQSQRLSVGTSFTSVTSARVSVVSGKKCLDLRIQSNWPKEELGSGLIYVATLKFKGVAVGSGTIDLVKADSAVSGYNPAGGDMAMEISTAVGTSYVIKAATGQKWGHATGVTACNTTTGNWVCSQSESGTFATQAECIADAGCEVAAVPAPVLNYRVTFAGLRPTTETACAGWPLSIVVKKGEVTKTYISTPTADGAVTAADGGQLRAYKGSVELTGFGEVSDVAVFVKGPKHLQMKYGINSQKVFYNRPGGEITLTRSAATSPVYDWTGYPVMVCDVVGSSSAAAQNGVCDAVDYSVVKKAASETKTVADGGQLLEDLDGNCKTNAVDLNLLMQTLKERQEQLY